MSIANRVAWKAFWALAACVWLAVLPAVAADAGDMIRDGAHQVDVVVGALKPHLKAPERFCDLTHARAG